MKRFNALEKIAVLSFLLVSVTACVNDRSRLWYSAADRGLPSGFYLSRLREQADPPGFPEPGSPRELLLSRSTSMTLEEVDTVFVDSIDAQNAELTLRWSEAGAQQLSAFMTKCYGSTVAFVHAGKVLVAPRVQEAFSGRQIGFSGFNPHDYLDGMRDSVKAAKRRYVTAASSAAAPARSSRP